MDWNLNNLSFSHLRRVLLCAHLISQSVFGEETRTDYKNPCCAQACCSTSPEQRAAGICRAVSFLRFRPECISVGNVQLRSQRWMNVVRRSKEAWPVCERMSPLLKKKTGLKTGVTRQVTANNNLTERQLLSCTFMWNCAFFFPLVLYLCNNFDEENRSGNSTNMLAVSNVLVRGCSSPL